MLLFKYFTKFILLYFYSSIKPIAKEIGRLAFEFVRKHHNAEPAPAPAAAPGGAPIHHTAPVGAPIHHAAHAGHPIHAHEPLIVNELPPKQYTIPPYSYPDTPHTGYSK